MPRSPLPAVLFALSAAVFLSACSETAGRPDAADKVYMDAKAYFDAPPGGGLTGLGQKCDPVAPSCPSNAPQCVFVGLDTGGMSNHYCTPYCLEDGSGTTTADGRGFTTLTPQPSTATCSAAFVGSVGTPQCTLILASVPADKPLQANKAYTGLDFGCLIKCGAGDACPSGLSCKMAGEKVCVPD